MKKYLFLIFLGVFCKESFAQTINAMSFNIRLNTSSDGINAWPNRSSKVSSQILFHEVDFVGLQEVLHNQIVDLQKDLPQYAYVGVGRDDGETKGEYSAVFYKKDRLSPIQSNTVWLSTTPTVPGSKGWDANIPRVVTWVLFKDLKSEKEFYVFNTHFDHQGKEARKESALYVLKLVDSIAGNHPVIITGDFNARPNDEPIQILTDLSNKKHLKNSQALSEKPHYGPTGTFNGWQSKEVDDEPIDYIFIKNNVRVLQHAILSQTWGGLFSSDHFPVFIKLML